MTRSLLTSLPEGWRSVPAKHATSLNPEVLSESSPEELELSYVDIAALEGGDAAASFSPKELTFGTAPSRARRVLRGGDTILSTVRTYLKAVANFPESREGLVASTGFAVLRPNGRLQPRFAYWAALSEPFIENVVAHSEGVSYPAINPSVLGSLHMPVPPLDTQERIANFLDEQTARIDALIAQKERLLNSMQELLSAEISSAVCNGLSKNAGMKPGPVPWLPYHPLHWRMASLKHVVDVRDGTHETPSYVDYEEDSYPLVTSKDVAAGRLSFEQAKRISRKDYEEISRRSGVARGDLLMPMIGTVGGAVEVQTDRPFAIKNLALFRTSIAMCDVKWLTAVLNSGYVRTQFAYMRSGGVQGFVGLGELRNLQVPLPPLDEQIAIAKHVSLLEQRFEPLIEHVGNHRKALDTYRSSLVSAAVTGQLDLSTFKAAT